MRIFIKQFNDDTILLCFRMGSFLYVREEDGLHTSLQSEYNNKRTAKAENEPYEMCAQRRFKAACASAQPDQSLPCQHKKKLCFLD